MVGENQETAMTEIALAMAMGFFSLMILAIVSVGIPKETNKAASTTAVIAKFTTLQSKNNSPIGKKVTKNDIFIVYDGKAFLNKNLETINPENINQNNEIRLEDKIETTRTNKWDAELNIVYKPLINNMKKNKFVEII